MKIGIIITTYQRQDNNTPIFLKRAVNSIKDQTYQDYLLIIIGDKYEDNDEFELLCKSFNLKEKLKYINLPIAKERDKYPLNSKELWSSGGVNARNHGIDIGLSLGFEYICHLDHDDYWHPQHLELITQTITKTKSPAFINTCSTYFNSHLPKVELTNQIIPHVPTPGGLIHSSVCINHKLILLKYRDVFEETGKEHAADADLWDRINKYINNNNLNSYLITSLTCFHPTENTINENLKL
jgi:glycosyltransferase involved in cell wall biosynthesis